ncbi:MAG: hypothetical protein A3F83_13420 [Candidatus Glassbacteria bacterium RIFCSPLOWO2_12_FULL_58_11]|uniref:Prepilin-type N-terminal cleavage/methylation domain-containing protein n=1 Tax=Candidatus Glassbacteria bacterium RIFCSPLOWO2_12_FULL_58_11 TaxID=1817867 RepID=A0A1F5YLZ6_9BACT|nr:MAG: hypothetical protein A3F83_13420 [Candidatus Glassbacteria bacterium RIFCSPLOWO2_12_FULL_58_11]
MRGLRSNKGFTLIELLIVVVIIGILATVLISRFTGAKDSAYLAHCNTMAEAVKTAALGYSTSRIDGATATKISQLQKLNSDIAATVNDMKLTIAAGVLTIDHQKITESTKASVDLATGTVTPASLVE